MDGTGPEPTDGILVLRSTVTLVLSETVAWIFCFQFLHESVSVGFGDNRCGGNGEVDPIAFIERALGDGNFRNNPRIDEQMLRF